MKTQTIENLKELNRGYDYTFGAVADYVLKSDGGFLPSFNDLVRQINGGNLERELGNISVSSKGYVSKDAEAGREDADKFAVMSLIVGMAEKLNAYHDAVKQLIETGDL